MKTLKEWEDSDLEFHDFISPNDEVDEDMYDHFGDVVVPQYCNNDLLQVGEAYTSLDGVMQFETFSRSGDKYYYLGILPEFKK